jgi:two-component system sensor histidine kinase YesM
MIQNLGSILRYGISQYNSIVTLGEELLQLEKYIALQHIRFRSIYEIKIDIDGSLYSINMIKLLLQPIVENAIYHGMKDIRMEGIILVTANKPNPKTLILQVIDNGNGMTTEQITSLNGYINDENNLFHSIGLRNVNRRIKLHYGETYGLKITSIPGHGTTVTATIPLDIKT